MEQLLDFWQNLELNKIKFLLNSGERGRHILTDFAFVMLTLLLVYAAQF